VGGVDLHELGFRVRRRLDELFPEDGEPSELQRERREGLGSALRKIQPIADRLQWRIPVGAIEAFACELKRLRSAFAEERHLVLLIRLQLELCRYMTGRRRNIPPQALMVLMIAFRAMERLATDHRLSISDRRRLVERVLNEFLAFKRTLTADRCTRTPAPETEPRETSSQTGGPLKPQAYYLIPVNHVDDLRGFLKAEFDRLERALRVRS
jgi:hypothetical protein